MENTRETKSFCKDCKQETTWVIKRMITKSSVGFVLSDITVYTCLSCGARREIINYRDLSGKEKAVEEDSISL